MPTPIVSKLTLILVTVAIYLAWMDMALFINLQQLPPLEKRLAPQDKDSPFSPFDNISIKLLMMCPILHYIDLPIAMWIQDALIVSNYLTANAVSYIGVCCGLVAARLFMCDSYKIRLLGFAFYRLRDLADALDGIVARAYMNEHMMKVKPGTWGYAIDGICDGIADVAVIFASGYYLLKSVSNCKDATTYSKLEQGDNGTKPASFWLRLKSLKMQWFMPIAFKTVLFAITFGCCSGVWNYFMYNYSTLFDTTLIAQTEHQQNMQLAVLKTPIMWLVIIIWRWLNAVSMIQYFVIAILYNKVEEFLNFMKQHGPIIVLTASLISYLHYTYALYKINDQY